MCCCNSNSSALSEDFVVYGYQFANTNEYQNSLMKGRYRIELRGLGTLIRKVEWDYRDEGGFKILITNFIVTPDVIIIGEFY